MVTTPRNHDAAGVSRFKTARMVAIPEADAATGTETERLYDRGELSEAELAELMPGWRERYEQAQKPGFSYCIGHKNPGDTFASWIEGLAAQKALYRWAGIPVAIIRRWDAERRRSAKDVKSLAIRARCRSSTG